jgi:hypothetical protein
VRTLAWQQRNTATHLVEFVSIRITRHNPAGQQQHASELQGCPGQGSGAPGPRTRCPGLLQESNNRRLLLGRHFQVSAFCSQFLSISGFPLSACQHPSTDYRLQPSPYPLRLQALALVNCPQE